MKMNDELIATGIIQITIWSPSHWSYSQCLSHTTVVRNRLTEGFLEDYFVHDPKISPYTHHFVFLL